MPIFGGVEVARGKAVRPLLKGVYIVDGTVARQVQKLFVDSARFKKFNPPKGFTMTAGEIFYEGGKIAEVRLKGNLPPVKDKDVSDFDLLTDEEWAELVKRKNEHWSKVPVIRNDEWAWRWPSWATKRGPDFTWLDDLCLAFSPRSSLGRPYVAALRFGGPILLWWDVASGRTHDTPVDADVRHIRVTQPVNVAAEKNDKRGFEAAIRYLDGLGRSADAMKDLLTLLKDGSCIDFIDDRRAFGSAFSRLLVQWIDESSPDSTGQLSFSMKKLKEPKMREKMINAVAAMTSGYFIIRSGRPRGSQTKNPKLKAGKIDPDSEEKAQLKKMILSAITGQYEMLRQRFPPAEAESQLKKKVVYKGLDVSKNTFDNWLERIGCSFEELKTETMKEQKIN